MNVLRAILTDLRERRLWPFAAALLIGIIAVPVLLTRGAKNAPTPAPAVAGLQASLPAGPTVSVGSLPDRSRLRGHERDPFAQQAASTSPAGTAVASGTGTTPTASTGSTGSSTFTVPSGSTASGATSAGAATTSGGSAGGTTTSSSSTTTSGSTTTTTTTTTTSTATPNPDGLTSKQSYSVAVAISNSSGGFDTVDPLVRLSAVPNQKQPLLLELGVLQGGHRVLFVVQPGTVVTGPGTCIPGPIDCAILSLGENETENVSRTSGTNVVPVGSFVVTTISTDDHGTRAGADKARRAESAFGRKLLDGNTSDVLSLFRYEPNVGAVVDLRNLTVGGS